MRVLKIVLFALNAQTWCVGGCGLGNSSAISLDDLFAAITIDLDGPLFIKNEIVRGLASTCVLQFSIHLVFE